MRDLDSRGARAALAFAIVLLAAPAALPGCAGSSEEPAVAPTPFSISAVVRDATAAEVAEALAAHIQGVDDTALGLPADWVVAGASELDPAAPPIDAVLGLPGGDRIIEVCNHHYASQAMAFGGHHGVALPCEIAVTQQGDDVEVVLLNPEAIFAVFFRDVPEEHAASMGGMAAAVRAELEDLVAAGLEGFDVVSLHEDVGPALTAEALESFAAMEYSVAMDLPIPAERLGSDEDRQAFRELFVDQLLETLTHEGMDHVGSTVEGLSTDDWRAARPYALGLPGSVSVVELCSPTYAGAALQTGAYHAPALPCQVAAWVEGDSLRVHLLAPTFIFPVFFGDAPEEMMEGMGGMAAAVQGDIVLMVAAAQAGLGDA